MVGAMDSATKAIEISIVVPVYNGSRYLEMLVEKTQELQMRWKQAKNQSTGVNRHTHSEPPERRLNNQPERKCLGSSRTHL